MPIVHFATAVRKGSHALVFLYGMSGGGKTLSALMIARGLAGPDGKVVAIDTETGRMLDYADDPRVSGFMYGELTAPFSPLRYIEAIEDAEKAGAAVLVFDSLSHEWGGIGGVLDLADQAEANGKKGLLKWAGPKAQHKKFVKKLLATRLHIVACMRAKDKFKQTNDGKVTHEGYTQEQDPRLIFEATVQLFMPNAEPRGVPVVEKCPGTLLAAFPEGQRITVETGARIRQWIDGAAPTDDTFERLKREGEEAAERGTDTLQAWWSRADVKPHHSRLAAIKDNLKSIAKEADAA
jgi:hypothetical protein